MMNMPLHVRSYILKTSGSGKTRHGYDPSDHILIVHLHKLFIPIGYDDKDQMLSILAHIHLGVVDHVIIYAYVKFCTWDGYNGHFMTLYHPINIRCFPKLDDLICNPPLEVFVTCRLHGDVDDNNK
jgi:hypothetical protein